ncbi:MAG: type IV pilin-like G/H family protein [Cyanobacteria bacterium J06626_18]
MTNNPQGDFTPPESPSATPANNSGKTALFIALGVGCGCLVLPIVVGILAAIALPSFLNQASRARETEAMTNLGAMNRGQQAYYLEYGEFAPSLEALDLGIISEGSYTYEVVPQSDPTVVVYMTATPTEAEIAAMSSAVFMLDDSEFNPITIICRGNTFATMPPALPSLDAANGVAYCSEGSATP